MLFSRGEGGKRPSCQSAATAAAAATFLASVAPAANKYSQHTRFSE